MPERSERRTNGRALHIGKLLVTGEGAMQLQNFIIIIEICKCPSTGVNKRAKLLPNKSEQTVSRPLGLLQIQFCKQALGIQITPNLTIPQHCMIRDGVKLGTRTILIGYN